ncbi:MAG: alanine--tRNA ligase [Bacteriovoracia bacterium]
MKTQSIRESFVKFFEKHNHQKHASSSLVPEDDPTLLFANAGMNQFKDFFTGKANPTNRRAVTIQKCVRAGGKHNDLENVGFTARHHTFFEMLGNFSFGDYFKREAIDFAWKFLTQDLNIPNDKLYVTVHYSDDEAAEIWEKEQNVAPDRIFRRGDKDNFWEMGDIGPCGPSSEIFYDHGPDHSDPNFNPKTAECLLDDEDRYVEIWNLVFMQFEKYRENGEIKQQPLPRPSVDTGAGLERITAVMQGKYWNYDTDVFGPLIKKLEDLSGKKYEDPKACASMRVIADHARSCTMLITDGVIPSNEGRGYVLRRIIRRAVRHIRELGIKELTLYKLIPQVWETLGQEYPQNQKNSALAEKMLKLEEKKFLETLDIGMKFLNEALETNLSNNTLPGEIAFKLYDTYGFPKDLTEVILREKNLKLDQEGFEKAMEQQRAQSRGSQKFQAQEDNKKVFYAYLEKFGPTIFKGYDHFYYDATLLGVEKIGDKYALMFDQTPYYAEAGGQVGDRGAIFLDDNFLTEIDDVQKPVEGLFVHYTKNAEMLEVGVQYHLKVDRANRMLTMKNHSATHLLQTALIKVLGEHVKQAGSMVGPRRLRFDFTHPEAMTREEIKKVEKIVNEQIQNSLPVVAAVSSKEEATAKGAMALFGEKYGDEVRTICVGDEADPYSLELCGGTHVKNTGDIGYFTILTEGALASGIRRIEALSSTPAIERLEKRSEILANLERNFSVKDKKVLDKVLKLQEDTKEKNKTIVALEEKIQAIQSKAIFDNVTTIANDYSFLATQAPENTDVRKLSDLFFDRYPKGILLLHSPNKGNIAVLLRTDKGNKRINCADILKQNLPIIEGRGGGKPDFAQGSGANKDKLDQFINSVKNEVAEKMEA